MSHVPQLCLGIEALLGEKGKETFDWQLACLLGLCHGGVGMLPSFSEISSSGHSAREFLGLD